MNDFFTSGEKLTAFKLNELFSRLSRRVESLEAVQNQASGGQAYNSGAVTAINGRPGGLINPLGAYPPRRHAINPQSFYTQGRTTIWQFPAVGEPDQGAGHSVTSGTTGYDTDAAGIAEAEEAESVTAEWNLTDFYPVQWTPHGEEYPNSATAFYGMEWAAGQGTHFLHLQKGDSYTFLNTYDPETGSITWSQPLGQPRALPWGSAAGSHGAWHYFQQNFNVIQPTAISSYSKTDGEFATVSYSSNGQTSSTAAPSEDASYALYSKIFLNGAKFKRLRGHLGTEILEHEGIISVKAKPWQIWYQALDGTDSDTVTGGGHGFGWYGFSHRAAHKSHSVRHLQVYPGSATVWWHVYDSADAQAAGSHTSKFGLNIYIQHVSAGVAQVAYAAEGGVILPSVTAAGGTSWTTAYAISNTEDFGNYGVAKNSENLYEFFASAGKSTLAWHVTDSNSSTTGLFGLHIAIERAADIDPNVARVRLTPWGEVQVTGGGHTGISSITTYIQTLSQTALSSAPHEFSGYIIIPAPLNYSLSGTIGEWHVSGIGKFGLMLYASAQAGDSGVTMQYQPYTLS